MVDVTNKKGGIICCLLLLVLLIIVFIIGSSYRPQVPVYFDNGYDNDFDIFVDGIKEGSVGPISMEEISIAEEGVHIIEIRKKNGKLIESRNVTLTEHDKYIYNIGGKYHYYIEICEYHLKGGTKWGGWDTKDIGRDTLMEYPDADYGFNENCPDSVVMYGGKTSDTRTKLKRENNPSAIKVEEDWHSGSGGKTLEVGQTSTIVLDSPKIVERAYIKVGCNDGEKMDGYIEYWDGQNWKYLTSFSDVGCGDYVPFDQVTTRKLRLTMTGGGGDDEHISWHCCGSDGWKVYLVADEEKEKESRPKTYVEKKSLIGYWNFDEGSENIAYDLSGNDNDGKISGTSLTSGIYGNALSFTGKKDSYVKIPESIRLDITDALTISVWIRPNAVTSYDRIVAKPHTEFASPYNVYSLIFDNAGHARFEGCIGQEQKMVLNGISKIPLNKWTHVAATYDGSQLKLYVNGNLESTKDVTEEICTNNMPLFIGSNVFYPDENFNGTIDEVRIYNYALSEDGIKAAAHTPAASPVTAKSFYAQKIISSDIRGSGNQYKKPDAALGPPDAQSGYEGFVSLGGEGWIIVDMGKDIVDGTGYDLEIYELGSSYPDSTSEAYKVFASKYPNKDWIYLEKGSDISGFDLADAGLDSVRYVKIVDDTGTNSGESPGADIDAIAGFLH